MHKLTEQVNSKLTPAEAAAIHAVAEAEERSVSNAVRRMIRYALANLYPASKA